jgi:hypothetical protein
MIVDKSVKGYKSFMQPLQDTSSPSTTGTEDQGLATGAKVAVPRNRDEARRYLLILLDRREFHQTIFMSRKYFFNGVILIEDLNFFMTSVSLALKNGHADAIAN